jgi:hypothetical protein
MKSREEGHKALKLNDERAALDALFPLQLLSQLISRYDWCLNTIRVVFLLQLPLARSIHLTARVYLQD